MLHDYLRDTLVLRYNECKSCGNRTQFACVRCGYCYSCHWKKEKLEKVRLEPLVANSAFLEKCPKPEIIEQSRRQQLISRQQQQEKTKIIDVYSQEVEPICNYHRCHHKFLLHGLGTRVCKCNHPQNHTTRVSILLSS
jgi:histidinol-phosphate/aromatic aminotransferase/cobyric acid decarboxylase-like protein